MKNSKQLVSFKPFQYVFVFGGKKDYKILCESQVEAVLGSYAYLMKYRHIQVKQQLKEAVRRGIKVMLDSGAFSAYHRGIALDIDEYIAFVRKFADYVSVAVNLDVIGDVEATNANWIKFHKALSPIEGLALMNVYHDSDPWRWYARVLEQKSDVLGVSSQISRFSTRQLQAYLDRIFREKPNKKMHGFALTSVDVLKRFPFYSADSSSWVKSCGYGQLISPCLGYRSVTVSERMVSSVKGSKGHVTNLLPELRDSILEDIEARGFTYEQVATTWSARARYNVKVLQDLQNQINDAREEHALKEAGFG